jgi:hypothetical protein
MTELVHPTSRERRLAFLEKRNFVDQKRYAVEDVLPARRIGSGIRRERKRMRIANLSDLTVAVPNVVENSRPLIPSGEREKKNESYRTLASRKHKGCVLGRVQRAVAVVFESVPGVRILRACPMPPPRRAEKRRSRRLIPKRK